MRQLPRPGFYVYNSEKASINEGYPPMSPPDYSRPLTLSIVYCSGTSKGNFYWDPVSHSAQWNRLLWTCVPSLRDAESNYDYHEMNPIGVPIP